MNRPLTGGYVGANHPSVKRNNRAVIFRAIYEQAPIARVDLAARTGLNDATVSNIVDELLQAELVREVGHRRSSGGRPAVELDVEPSARFAVGVDVTRVAVTAALVDLAGNVHERFVDRPRAQPWRAEKTIPTAIRVAGRLLEAVPTEKRDKIVGVGVGARNWIKIEHDRFFGFDTSKADWVDLGTTDAIRRQFFGLPTRLDSNMGASTLGELWFGAGRGVADFVLLHLSIGVGMGIVVGGDLYRGGNQRAGNIAHLPVAHEPRCECGNTGCLHKLVSVDATLGAARARLAAGEPSTLRKRAKLSFADLVSAYHAHDPVATSVFADMCHHLATALVIVIQTYGPSVILIGRDTATAGDLFFHQLRAGVRSRLDDGVGDEIRIEPARLPDEPVVGAATLALREFVRAPLDRPAAMSVRATDL